MPGYVKVSVNLPEEAVDAIRDISQKDGITMTEALRRSISTEKFVRDSHAQGSKILIEDSNKKIREVVFR